MGAAAASAQPPAGKVYRLGLLERSLAQNAPHIEAFRQGLRDLGYAEGRNFVMETRSADGRPERFPLLAAELVRLNVDVILTRGTPAAVAARNATATIPVVMLGSGDPVGAGLVSGLARPGGNITGLSAMVSELGGKRVELIKQAVPRIARIGFLTNGGNPTIVTAWPATEGAARALRLDARLLDVRKTEDLEPAFEAATRQRVEALVVGLDSVTLTNFKRIAELAARHRLPSIYPARDFVDAGGMMAYGTHYADLYRRAATYVDRIFRGAKPADLPIEQADRFELVINLKAARALGVTLPASLTVRADHLIR
ncbi:MAG TPA: ABC transporter substrate-binding protein [Methylomirabilota bacterium]|nr:ABC transporter substrate-binding protein [Methylomirabilota bacterium]